MSDRQLAARFTGGLMMLALAFEGAVALNAQDNAQTVTISGRVTAGGKPVPGIYVYSPAGKELAYIKTEIPTNVGFGRGAEAKTLYITAGKSLYRIGLNKAGYQLPAK